MLNMPDFEISSESIVIMVTLERTGKTFSPDIYTLPLSVYVVPKCLRCPNPSAALTSAWCLDLGLMCSCTAFCLLQN